MLNEDAISYSNINHSGNSGVRAQPISGDCIKLLSPSTDLLHLTTEMIILADLQVADQAEN